MRRELFGAQTKNLLKPNPFVKWVGGKRQLIDSLEESLPKDFSQWNEATYVEPFVGGGAMLFYMLRTYPNIKKAVINDINGDLINCYLMVKNRLGDLLKELEKEEYHYHYDLYRIEDKLQCYLDRRDEFNAGVSDEIRKAALFIFLNKTCFNGMCRYNRNGEFNVPFGKSFKPVICDSMTLKFDHDILQNVEMLTGNFDCTLQYANEQTLFYLDPPYRPINATSAFNTYVKEPFTDETQFELKDFCDAITERGSKFMLSNSDCPDGFFDRLYMDYNIKKVLANRMVNADPDGRGKITELLITNY